MFKGNSSGNPFAVTEGKSVETGSLFSAVGTPANASSNQFSGTEENPFANKPTSFQFTVPKTAGNSSVSVFPTPPGISLVSSAPGSFFTEPFSWETSEAKVPTSETENSVPQDSTNRSTGRPLFRPSVGLFGQAIGDALKSGTSKSSRPTASPASNEIQTLQSLYVSDIPDKLLNKTLLMEHFSQFGKVIKAVLSARRKSFTLNFDSHESAERAKTRGTKISNVNLTIFWAKPASSRRSDGGSPSAEGALHSPRGPVKSRPKISGTNVETDVMRQVRSKVIFGQSDQKTFGLADDVQDELNAMRNQDSLRFAEDPSASSQHTRKIKSRIAKPVVAPSKLKSERTAKGSRDVPSQLRTARSTTNVDTEMVYSSTVSMDELHKILRTTAHTAEERYRVLEARDKLMRMKRVRESDLSKARINRGTCPDMCPEKERYHREYQRQVAAYELGGAAARIDHARAVKQYSRSSADQEEPLSHELRPPAVLRLTMDYLMWKLMDICNKKDENMADWYHYIWDRTRGIRKDITQQELCDENTVMLVEQCARWHIVCSERLIAEDLMVYDDNINTENLTKCLQTLKYMYQDMSLKGIVCPNEAEFRAYFVLLNLNEGDCMWEVQQLSSAIRESQPVHFALQVSAALSSNNYVRFFKLVRSTTYLNACILHRYFAQVRSRALHTIVRAYCARTNTAVYTLEEIVRLCGLGTTDEAAILCLHYGLKLTEDSSSVVFSRRTYTHPETALPAYRVLSLVEAKRHCSVGETVSGGAEPNLSFESHVPHDSFNSKGLLKPSSWTASDQGVEGLSAEVEENQPDVAWIENVQDVIDQASLQAEAALQQKQEMAILKICNEVVDEVVNDECCNIVEKSMKDAHLDFAAVSFYDEVFADVTEEMASEIFGKVLSEEIINEKEKTRLAEVAAEAEMLEKMRQKKFLQEFDRYLDEFMMECCQKAIQDELAFEQLQIKLTKEVIEEFVQEECQRIVDTSVAEARAVEVEKIRARFQHRQLKHLFNRWRKYTKKSKYRNQSMADFPAWMSNLTLDEQVSSLDQPDPFVIENMNRKRFAANKSKLLALEHEVPTIPQLDVGNAVQNQLSARMKELSCFDAYLFWKVLISIPDPQEAPQKSNVIQRWTDTVFSFSDGQSVSCSQVKPSTYETLTICIRSMIGNSEASYSCQGTNGILFWVSHKDESLVDAQNRLGTLLKAKPKYPSIPVAIVVSGPMTASNKQIYRELNLASLREAGFVSYYKVFTRSVNTGEGLTNQLKSACEWLAELAPLPSSLTVMTMRHLMNHCLTDEFWGQVRASGRGQNPNDFIELYNAVLEKMRELFFDESLVQWSSGAIEFRKYLDCDILQEQRGYHIAPEYWGLREYYDCVEKVLSDSRLSMIADWPPADHGSLKDSIVAYCKSQGLSHIISDIYHVIEQHTRMQLQSRSPGYNTSDWQSFLKSMPWSFAIQMMVEARLEALDCNSPGDFTQPELRVMVNRQSLSRLQTSRWWLSELSEHDSSGSSAENITEEERGVNKRSFIDESPLPSKQRKISLVEVYSNIKSACTKIDATVNAVKATWAKIDSDVAKPPM